MSSNDSCSNLSTNIAENCSQNDFVLSNYLYFAVLTLGSLNVLINSAFLLLLYKARKRVNWKRYSFVANLSVSDIVMNAFWIILKCVGDDSTYATRLILKTALIWAIHANSFSYTGSILVQYYAVKKPLSYKANLHIAGVKRAIVLIWIFTVVFVGCKTALFLLLPEYVRFYARFELCTQAGFFLFNTFAHAYVLNVGKKELDRKNSKDQYQQQKSNANDGGLRKNYSHSNLLSADSSLRLTVKEHSFAVTIGISLAVYWFTVTPMWFYWLTLEVTGEGYYNMDFSVTKQALLLIWFSRASFDPLLFAYREPKLKYFIKRDCFRR